MNNNVPASIKAAKNSIHETIAHLKTARYCLFTVEFDDDGDRYDTCTDQKLERKLRSTIDRLEALTIESQGTTHAKQ